MESNARLFKRSDWLNKSLRIYNRIMTEEKELAVHAFVIPVTPFQQNCSILWCTETKKGAVIDPGGDIDQIITAINKYDVKICLLYTSPSPRDATLSRMPSSA